MLSTLPYAILLWPDTAFKLGDGVKFQWQCQYISCVAIISNPTQKNHKNQNNLKIKHAGYNKTFYMGGGGGQ